LIFPLHNFNLSFLLIMSSALDLANLDIGSFIRELNKFHSLGLTEQQIEYSSKVLHDQWFTNASELKFVDSTVFQFLDLPKILATTILATFANNQAANIHAVQLQPIQGITKAISSQSLNDKQQGNSNIQATMTGFNTDGTKQIHNNLDEKKFPNSGDSSHRLVLHESAEPEHGDLDFHYTPANQPHHNDGNESDQEFQITADMLEGGSHSNSVSRSDYVYDDEKQGAHDQDSSQGKKPSSSHSLVALKKAVEHVCATSIKDETVLVNLQNILRRAMASSDKITQGVLKEHLKKLQAVAIANQQQKSSDQLNFENLSLNIKEKNEEKKALSPTSSEGSPPTNHRSASNGSNSISLLAAACGLCNGQKDRSFTLDCKHSYDISCIRDYINSFVGKQQAVGIKCPVESCGKELSNGNIQNLLLPEEFESYLQATLMSFIESDGLTFLCPNDKCKAVISIEPVGKLIPPTVITEAADDGRILSPEAWLHFSEYRVRCRECNSVFCAQCKEIPYHKGYTCATFKEYQSARHCRFCESSLDPSNTWINPTAGPGLRDMCTEEECKEKAALSCDKLLLCGCFCGGVKGEKECLPCLKHELECEDEYCAVCYVDALKAAPAIKMTGPCTHVLHFACVKTKLETRWPGARITFEFRGCPLCKQYMQHPALEEVLKPICELEKIVTEKAVQRLKYEGRDKDPAIINKNGEFFNNPTGFAMKQYLFYMCFKCSKPYFAGGYQCQEANAAFDPAELICPACQPHSVEDCNVHGKDWLAYKCRYCCSFANWYCLAGESLINLASGVAAPIENLIDLPNVHSFDAEISGRGGIIAGRTVKFHDKREQECVELTMSDGRKLILTPEHRILTVQEFNGVDNSEFDPEMGHTSLASSAQSKNHDSMSAENLRLNETLVLVGLDMPRDEREPLEQGFSLCLPALNQLLEMNSEAGRQVSLAFARLLGYLSAFSAGPYIEFQHSLDVNQFQEDHLLLTGQGCSIRKQFGSSFLAQLSAELLQDIHSFNGKSSQFLASSSCPTSFLREFLAAFFGFAALPPSPQLLHNSFHPIILPANQSNQQILDFLARFNLSAEFLSTAEKKLSLSPQQTAKFSELIGFRYSCGKQLKLTAAAAYYRFTEAVRNQRRFIVNQARVLISTAIPLESAVNQALSELQAAYPILHPQSIPSLRSVASQINQVGEIPSLDLDEPVSLSNFLTEIHAEEVFSQGNCNKLSVPTLKMRVIYRKSAGIRRVYDISVPETHNFFANGVAVSNCWGSTHFCLSSSSLLKQYIDEKSYKCVPAGALAVGDLVLDHNSQPVPITAFSKGHAQLYKVEEKNPGNSAALSSFDATPDHILCLVSQHLEGIRYSGKAKALRALTFFDSQCNSHTILARLHSAAVLSYCPETVHETVEEADESIWRILREISRTRAYQGKRCVPLLRGDKVQMSITQYLDLSPAARAGFRQYCAQKIGNLHHEATEIMDLDLNAQSRKNSMELGSTVSKVNSSSHALVRDGENWREFSEGDSVDILIVLPSAVLNEGSATARTMTNLAKVIQLCSPIANRIAITDTPSFTSATGIAHNYEFAQSLQPRYIIPIGESASLQLARSSTLLQNSTTFGISTHYRQFQQELKHQFYSFQGLQNSSLLSSLQDIYISLRIAGSKLIPRYHFDGSIPIEVMSSSSRVYEDNQLKPLYINPSPSQQKLEFTAITVEGKLFQLSNGIVTHNCDKCHKSGVWQNLAVFRSGKNKKKLWEYENCSSLKPQVEAIGRDNSLSEEAKNEKISKLLSTKNSCQLGCAHPPTGLEFGLGCSMCEDSHSSGDKLKEDLVKVREKLLIVRNEIVKNGPKQFVYGSDFDENGLMFYLGTCGKTAPYTNPAAAGFVRVTSSGLMGDSMPLSSAVGRETVRCVTTPVRNSWFQFEIVDFAMSLTAYTLRHYNSWDTECLRNWELAGSNDGGATWENLSIHQNDQALNKKGATATWPVNSQGRKYRLFRLLQTSRNSNNNFYLPCSGLEFYGILYNADQAQLPLGSGAVIPQKSQLNMLAESSISPQPVSLNPFQAPLPVAPSNSFKTFNYHHDFDQNGIVWYLGTKFGTNKQWFNPCELGLARVTCSELASQPASAPASAAIGREVVRCVSASKPNQWFTIDFTVSGKRIRPTAYTLRHYNSWDLEALRNWRFEGSINGMDW
jgi:hypothetical protein